MMPKLLRFITFLAPNMRPVYQFVAAYVGEQLGCQTELVTGTAWGQFAAGEADIGFICGRPYVELRRQASPPIEPLAAPVLQGERYQNRPIYYSDVIVRGDSPFSTFADLRGRSWAYNDLDSHSGYGVTLYRLAQLGAGRGYFGRVVEAGFHQQAIRMVAAGEIDAAAIDSQVLAIERRDHPELAARLKIIDALGPSTIQPVVAAAHLPASLQTEVQAVLVAMGDDPAAQPHLAHGFVSHFAPVTDATYDDIRGMMAAADAAGIRVIR